MGRLSNNQKAFNTVWQHFVVKKAKQSIVETAHGDAYWALRGPYNRRDAIGLLLSDEQYHPDMERLTLEELLQRYPDLQLVTKDTKLLAELEWAHDIAVQSHDEFLQRIKIRLRGIAEEFNLRIP
jgi:enoyl reductase-like protein